MFCNFCNVLKLHKTNDPAHVNARSVQWLQGVEHDELLMSRKYDVAAFSAPDPVLIAVFSGLFESLSSSECSYT